MASKKILLWGALPRLPKNKTYRESYQISGNNFGNILIGHGVVSVLGDYEYIFRSQLKGPEDADEQCERIVIPAANFLWKGFDFGYMADFIEATHLPVTILGLGAQTNDRSMVSYIHPNTLRLIKLIAERSPSLGVRGFYTAEVLAANGILNVEVLGCPSLYTNLAPPQAITPPRLEELGGMVVNFSRRVSGHAFSKPALMAVENALLKMAMRLDLPFVAQDELEELALAFGDGGAVERKTVATYFSSVGEAEVTSYFSRKTQYFCDVDEWSAFMRQRSGTVGSRLHGNIISLINGKTGFVIAHDSRTLEVCALTGIPYLNIKQIYPETFREEELIERVLNADYGKFVSNIGQLFRKYRSFLDTHGLRHKLTADLPEVMLQEPNAALPVLIRPQLPATAAGQLAELGELLKTVVERKNATIESQRAEIQALQDRQNALYEQLVRAEAQLDLLKQMVLPEAGSRLERL